MLCICLLSLCFLVKALQFQSMALYFLTIKDWIKLFLHKTCAIFPNYITQKAIILYFTFQPTIPLWVSGLLLLTWDWVRPHRPRVRPLTEANQQAPLPPLMLEWAIWKRTMEIRPLEMSGTYRITEHVNFFLELDLCFSNIFDNFKLRILFKNI